MPDRRSPIADLVHRFSTHIKAYKAKDFKEAEVRSQFIDPFWLALGWDVRDSKSVGPSLAEVIIEKNIDTAEVGGLRRRRPDYLFRVGGFARFIVEAKKPSVDLDLDKDGIFQAKQYAWNSTIPFAILTDFEQFRLYDTTLKPIFNDPRRGLVTQFALDYDKYESQWDVLTDTFGRSAVEGGALERLLASVKKVKAGRRIRTVDRMLIDLKGGEPVDQAFLSLLDAHRKHFAAAIYRANKPAFPEADTLHGAAKLTEAVQRIMDRLVFMRVCEDRGIVPFGQLRETLDRIGAEGGEFYEALRAEFREWDAKYNGYLFKPWPLEDIHVEGAVLADFVRDLYPPDGPWDFAAIGDDILGTVYERFLGNTIVVKRGQASVEEKMEVRHAGGVYYTPRFVVDSIIRRVIGPKVAGKTPAEVLDVKILDPACGSGSFLVAALQYLFDCCLAAVHADPSVAKAIVPALSAGSGTKGRKKKAEIAFQDKEGRWYLAPDFRAALLTHCIHGVDIDQQAVEVTVMSLYLKMLESKLPENWATLWVERQLLPTLDNNIQCGNSLLDDKSYDDYTVFAKATMGREDKDATHRINRFDWESRTKGFGRLLDSQAVKERGRAGFDCIIGNPPYIRVQELNKWAPEECEFYKWKYKAAAKGSYDIYMVFTERALGLLARDGLLGFIMPHKFWQNRDADGLRKIIADGKHLKAVVDFTDQQVFKGATTYTAIHVLAGKNGDAKLDVAKITSLDDGITQCAAIDAGRAAPGVERFTTVLPVGSADWRFHDAATGKFLAAMTAVGQPLYPDVCEAVFQGIVTGADPIFLTNNVKRSSKSAKVVELHSEELERFVSVEADLLVPVVRRQGFQSYIAIANHWLILPYDRTNGDIIPWATIEKDYPLFADYVAKFRNKLEKREKGKFASRWWGFSGAKNIELWGRSKILVPYMIETLQAVADDEGRFFVNVTTGGYGLALQPKVAAELGKEGPAYIVGLLNSRLLDYVMRRLSNHFHGGYYPANKQYLQHLPIKLPATAAEKKLAERITEAVGTIMDAKATLRQPKLSDRETNQHHAAIEAHEAAINKAVFALYGVKGLPGA